MKTFIGIFLIGFLCFLGCSDNDDTARTVGQAIPVTPFGLIETHNPTYEWTPVPGATRYQLLVEDVSGTVIIEDWYTAEEADCESEDGLCKVTPDIEVFEENEFRVQTCANDECGLWSGTLNFNSTTMNAPRFTDNGDDTVTDNNTGLTWSKNANLHEWRTWQESKDFCSDLTLGGHSDWRLPALHELYSLIDLTTTNPALPLGHPFTNVQPYWYWSSTNAYVWGKAETVSMENGSVRDENKTMSSIFIYGWPVKCVITYPLKAMKGNNIDCNQALDCNPTAIDIVSDIKVMTYGYPCTPDLKFAGSPGEMGYSHPSDHWQGASRFYPTAANGVLADLFIVTRSENFKQAKNQFEVYKWPPVCKLQSPSDLEYDKTDTEISNHFSTPVDVDDVDFNHSSCPQVIGKYFVMGAENKNGGGNYCKIPHTQIKIFDASPLGNTPPEKPVVVGHTIDVHKDSQKDEKWAAAATGIIKLKSGHFLIASLTTEHEPLTSGQAECLGMLLYISSTTNLETAEWRYIDNVRFRKLPGSEDDPNCSNCSYKAYNSLHLASDNTGDIFGILGYNNSAVKGGGWNKVTVIRFTVHENSATGKEIEGCVQLEQVNASEVDFGASMGIFIRDGRLEIYGTEYFDGPDDDSLTLSNWRAVSYKP